jgi:transcriptional enhancer factor
MIGIGFKFLTSSTAGLERYIPDDSRETRMLGRFPRRNRFISDYIFQKTGKRRSAKQVGSRLQQLRESCGGKKRALPLDPIRQYPDPFPSFSATSALSLSKA